MKNLYIDSGIIELSPKNLEETNGGIIIASGLAVAGYFLGGIAVGAAIGYGASAAIEGIEGWFE
ncbi:hypothetical protein I215_11758 [Galbibacter marinus]|uniref:Uncharacterized protein n=1 Tax=Galbibacter marinus TaxID=555500 RepID=K2PSJ5_9FLAO|nr:hypothetical protein [Galbibacter marinus]EKF54524.1 hypothetical protein I215_11758 [Galbibacter marinus]